MVFIKYVFSVKEKTNSFEINTKRRGRNSLKKNDRNKKMSRYIQHNHTETCKPKWYDERARGLSKTSLKLEKVLECNDVSIWSQVTSYKCLFFLCPSCFYDLKNWVFGKAYEMFPGKPDHKCYELIATFETKRDVGMCFPPYYYSICNM